MPKFCEIESASSWFRFCIGDTSSEAEVDGDDVDGDDVEGDGAETFGDTSGVTPPFGPIASSAAKCT